MQRKFESLSQKSEQNCQKTAAGLDCSQGQHGLSDDQCRGSLFGGGGPRPSPVSQQGEAHDGCWHDEPPRTEKGLNSSAGFSRASVSEFRNVSQLFVCQSSRSKYFIDVLYCFFTGYAEIGIQSISFTLRERRKS